MIVIPIPRIGCLLTMGVVGLTFNTLSLFGLADYRHCRRQYDHGDVERYLEQGTFTPEAAHIGSVATFRDVTGPLRVARYNLYPAAEVQFNLDRGYSTGDQGIKVIEQLAAQRLPPGFTFVWTEIALQEKLAGNTAVIAFGLAVVFVFLLLAALYESWLLPLAVILIVPMCILAAMIGVKRAAWTAISWSRSGLWCWLAWPPRTPS